MSDNSREQELHIWLHEQCGIDGPFRQLSGDASFRKYYRGGGVIAVDADPATQKNHAYTALNALLHAGGIPTFRILHEDPERGFFAIEDLGDDLLLRHSKGRDQLLLYQQAIDLLPKIAALKADNLPPFDQHFILGELELLEQWLLDKTLRHTLSRQEGYILQHAFMILAQNCADQRQLAMHRDYHARNLMVKEGRIWVLDYQDMVRGPALYDLASLLYDCYVRLAPAVCRTLLRYAFKIYMDSGLLDNLSYEYFVYQIRLTALQRHIKVLGLFCRLALRDGKRDYLQYLPRVMDYVLEECACDELFADFQAFLTAEVRDRLPS